MQKILKIIKDAKITGDSQTDKVNRDLQQLLKVKTKDFTDASAISEDKRDMTTILEERNKSVEDYVKKYGSVMRSEADVVRQLAKEISGEETPAPNDEPDVAVLLLIAEAEVALAEAAEAEAKRKKKGK